MIKVIYRMSDKSQIVSRPTYVNLVNCLLNFLANVKFDEIVVIADNVNNDTFEIVTDIIKEIENSEILRTESNNAESFKTALDIALKETNDTIIFFVEDDYVWKPLSTKILLEGINTNRYISLYDHPDKYGELYHFGEISKLYITETTHWKTTLSTPMTFACYVKTLKEDKDIILESLENRVMTWSSKMFKLLYAKYGEQVVSTPIPSYATHGMNAWLSPFVDWESIMRESLKYK